ncbi:MAG: hypothetical protein QY325_00980 [Flavobacteriales bacterium]|nr:MAG: hypothetical protein QY325_00980 [Flavobacteriales bacterium]
MTSIDWLPKDAQVLIEEARANDDFHSDHSDCLTGAGERSVDFMEYRFPLADGQDLLMRFVDFSLDSYTIVERELDEPENEPELLFEVEEPDPNK